MKIGYLLQEGVPSIRKKPLSGPANHVVSVIEELKKAGHQVSLLAKLDKEIYLSNDLENFRPVEVRFLETGLIKLFEKVIRRIQFEYKLPYANFFDSLRFAFACRLVLSDCDIYFERMGWLGYGGAIASQLQHIPLVWEVNGDHIDEFRIKGILSHKSQHQLSYYLMEKATRKMSHVVATGEGWRQRYIERWKAPPATVSVVENGSALVTILQRQDLNAFKPIEPGEPMRIAYCGGFEPWHGIPVLIRAVRSAIDHGCKLHVTLIGSGSEEDKIVGLIQELGLAGSFTLTGQLKLKQLAGYLAKADVGVSPYFGRVEYSGLKLLDYKAAGLAIIASGENNQPSVITHQRTGWIVPPGDEISLSQAIITFSENPQLRTRIGREARIEAEVIHTWHHTVVQLLDIFNCAIENRTKNERL